LILDGGERDEPSDSRAIARRAAEAVVRGMRAVNADLMLHEMLDKAEAT